MRQETLRPAPPGGTDPEEMVWVHTSAWWTLRPIWGTGLCSQGPTPVSEGSSLADTLFGKQSKMAEGTIKRLTDKGFGFIDTGSGKDMFFHMSNLEGVRFEDLREGQRVSFDAGEGPKGPRAENVRVL